MKEKSDKVECLVFIKDFKGKYGYVVKYIQCDNAGKNQALETACKWEGLCGAFECTTPSTPQQNSRVERKFATLFGSVPAILNGGGFDKFWHHGLPAEAANTATLL